MIIVKPRALAALVVFFGVSSATAALAEPPRPMMATDAVRERLDQVVVMLHAPAFRAMDPARQRDEVRRVSAGLFNWPEIARRTLGDEWRALGVTDRRTFTGSLASLAERAYMGPVEALAARGVPREPVRYLAETTEGAGTVVRTVLMYPRELPIDFVMHRPVGRWEVWDVRVAGVSAADNYRAQFLRIIGQSSFGALVARMHAKIDEPSEFAAVRVVPSR